MKNELEAIEFQNMINHRYTTLHAIETTLSMLEIFDFRVAGKDDHETLYVIRPAIQKANEALKVLRDELKKELREAFVMHD